MRIKAAQLAAQLKKPFTPIYLILGEEPLQLRESTDLIRSVARQQGYQERVVFYVDTGFDWNQFDAEANSLSLFAQRRILELDFGSRTPNEGAGKILQAYCAHPPAETLLLITVDKLDGQKQKTKWFIELEKIATIVLVSAIEIAQLPQWIAQRMQQAKLQATPEAIELLAERSEGHLLACAQEIEKLALLYPNQSIDTPQVLEAVADSARFEVFGWVESVLKGDAPRSVRQLENLRSEGQDAFFICWALQQELRNLAQISFAIQQGESMDMLFKQFRIWSHRQTLIKQALKRYPTIAWQRFLKQSIKIDKIVKGVEIGDPWDELKRLSLFVSGVRVFATAKKTH
ncbi:DNA polymerase III subunit delta [Thioflexithrix psekupsensis]|uniref:DNA polymerase III subunit delta n=1 Tax=Thioflexithrix psekupsensis TaxID=1570016 RepID=A0A251X442_9GAMM|nr:DNA polymerase III subunit delta [Thioflexithrix psekupsensis]OUD12156.1 DNA polymerase III subunit delta [Thioflexithrix psekupsensis]